MFTGNVDVDEKRWKTIALLEEMCKWWKEIAINSGKHEVKKCAGQMGVTNWYT